MEQRQLREQNRRSWNAVVPAHESHRPAQAEFFRRDGNTLFPEERELLGDVRDKDIAHLLCNAGQDTLSLAQLGARVVGVDISDEAIARARALATECGLDARFERADVYDWLAAAQDRAFDIVYCAYGTICWLHDIDAWAHGVAAVLRPGGRFVLLEFHPLSNMLDHQWRWSASYPAGGQQLDLEGVGDYVGASEGLAPGGFDDGIRDFQNPEPAHLFRWGVGEVVSALAGAGLVIETLREYPFANGERPFSRMVAGPGRRMLPPPDVPQLPLMYGLAARKVEGLGAD